MGNILPFGTCPVLGGPCVPAPVGPWLNTHDKTMIADAAPGGPLYPAVTMKSFLVCALGGLIEPKKSGQEYKTPGASSTLDGKIPANTGRYEDASSKEPAGTLFTSDDWAFYGRDGNLFEPNPDLNKEFGVFGGPIEYEWGTQAEIDLSLVD